MQQIYQFMSQWINKSFHRETHSTGSFSYPCRPSVPALVYRAPRRWLVWWRTAGRCALQPHWQLHSVHGCLRSSLQQQHTSHTVITLTVGSHWVKSHTVINHSVVSHTVIKSYSYHDKSYCNRSFHGKSWSAKSLNGECTVTSPTVVKHSVVSHTLIKSYCGKSCGNKSFSSTSYSTKSCSNKSFSDKL